MPRRIVHTARAAVAVAALTVGGTATASSPSTAPPLAPIADDAIRAAKVGWSRFVADNFAVPTAVPDPCPLLTVDAANSGVAGLGLVATDLPFGVSLYRDATGAGIISILCGADLAKAPSPPGATLLAVEVTLLDGQAVFPQYVVRVAGNGTPISASPELGGDVIARCRNDPQYCVASWHSDGLVVTSSSTGLEGPRVRPRPGSSS